jgi:hypothetical protein
MGTNRIALCALFLAVACKAEDKKAGEVKPTTGPATGDPVRPASGEQPAAEGEAAPRQVEAAPPPKLHEKPVERRLYSDRIEASSFLWTDWNKFQENYHPNYILDGDPATAWVEGADSSGKGEWVRVHLSPVESVSKIRLRIQNGYHKSKALHGKNGRLKAVEIVALPSNTTHKAELADSMDWQEVAFDHPTGKLEAIELRAADVYEGSKYTDLCVSDLEIFVTGLTVENPAFEKSKLEGLLAWKKNRLAAAKILTSTGAADLPILPGYRVVRGEEMKFSFVKDGKAYNGLRSSLVELAPHAGPAYADAAARAAAGLENGFHEWVKVQVVAKKPIELPGVDGLRAAENEELVYGGPEDVFLLPSSDQGILLRSSHLSTFDTKGGNPMDRTDCKVGRSEFMRPPRKPDEWPAVRELLHVRCVSEETREGMATYMTWQLLEFDADGNLVLVAGPHNQVQWLEWQKGEKGPVLAGGGRLKHESAPLEKLIDARVVARD